MKGFISRIKFAIVAGMLFAAPGIFAGASNGEVVGIAGVGFLFAALGIFVGEVLNNSFNWDPILRKRKKIASTTHVTTSSAPTPGKPPNARDRVPANVP
ncbi:MAG: hypothetical protein F4Y61_00475 [Rhodothermaceae bacterium]|nr:hypothetical protein [Rhodothermaceae bacterium]